MPPGEYRVLAFRADQLPLMNQTSPLERALDRAKTIKLERGAPQNLTLQAEDLTR